MGNTADCFFTGLNILAVWVFLLCLISAGTTQRTLYLCFLINNYSTYSINKNKLWGIKVKYIFQDNKTAREVQCISANDKHSASTSCMQWLTVRANQNTNCKPKQITDQQHTWCCCHDFWCCYSCTSSSTFVMTHGVAHFTLWARNLQALQAYPAMHETIRHWGGLVKNI